MKKEEVTVSIEPPGYFGTLEEQSGHAEPSDASRVIVVTTPTESRAQTVHAWENDHDSWGAIADIIPEELQGYVESLIEAELKGEPTQ